MLAKFATAEQQRMNWRGHQQPKPQHRLHMQRITSKRIRSKRIRILVRLGKGIELPQPSNPSKHAKRSGRLLGTRTCHTSRLGFPGFQPCQVPDLGFCPDPKQIPKPT